MVGCEMALTFDQVRDAAKGNWKTLIFPAFGLHVPAKPNVHGPCPICGGKDRFRCDDKYSNGSWYCNLCIAGDGFALIEKAREMKSSEVLHAVASVLGISTETTVTDEDRKKWREKAEAQKKQQETDERKAQEEAAKRALRIWNAKSVDRDCPYLERKQVHSNGCKVNGKGNLIVPLFDRHGAIWNIQEIHADGHKPFLACGRVSGCFYMIGSVEYVHQIICIAEGFATAASIYEATGYTTVVSFNAGNMYKVGLEIRASYPNARFVYCADDDSQSTPPDAGLKAANKAVAATGGIVILPVIKQVVSV